MKRLMLASVLLAAPTMAFADGMFWVAGSHASGKCEIVTSNPVVDGADVWFADGPYKSESDAKLARSTIRACPKVEDPKPGMDAAKK